MQAILFMPLISLSQPIEARKKINFDEGWRFQLGHAADAAKDFNFTIANIFSKSGKGDGSAVDPKFNDSAWRQLNLPHDWAVELPFANSPNFDVMAHGYKPVGGLFPQNSIGWYRKHFNISKEDSGQRFVIQFDGIFRDSKIWLNGFYLGNNQSGYVGVQYDITDYINFHGDNVLVVRADASQYEGWFYEGAGIYRHAWLQRGNNLHIADEGGVYVHTNVQQGTATITVETKVVNSNLSRSNCSVHAFITDREGNILARADEQALSLDVKETELVKKEMVINNPELWNLQAPYLYRVVTMVKAGSYTLDSLSTRFGIRTFAFSGENGFSLNGKHVKLQGVNCHQDHAGVGSAMPDYLQYYRLQLLKELGVNAYRTSHHAPTPELLDACDSLGILVLDEQRLLNSSPEYMDQFERLIYRDRNHASVFLWSIGNEEGYIQANSIGKRLAQTLLAKQLQLDPTRSSTYAADMGNVYTGVNEIVPVRGFNYRQFAVADYHKDHPLQPVVGTEMGSTVTTRGIYTKDSLKGYVPDQDITAPWWASRAEEWWVLAAQNPYWMGGFVWTGFDYRGEPTPFEWPNINSHFGIMDMCGFPKNIYYYYQSWWTDKDVLHISPHWNWPGKEGKNMDVWVNSNAQNVELFLNNKSLGKKTMQTNKHLQWNVPYKAGVLKAVAYKNGKKLETSVETTGPAYQLVLWLDRRIISANGTDATVVNVAVKDKQGREVPDANNLIQFTIRGPAKIIGVGNGDPSCHEPDKCAEGQWQRSLFNGKCQLIIQAGTTPGEVQLEAKATGLEAGNAIIQLLSQK